MDRIWHRWIKVKDDYYLTKYSKTCVIVLITVQRDATESSLFIILQVHSTCFGCQPRPSSGVHKTVTTVSGTVQLPPSNVAWLATLEGGRCTVPETVVTVLCTPDDGCC